MTQRRSLLLFTTILCGGILALFGIYWVRSSPVDAPRQRRRRNSLGGRRTDGTRRTLHSS